MAAHFSFRGPSRIRCSMYRKYPAVTIKPKTDIVVINLRTGYVPQRDMNSLMNPLRPGRPREASAKTVKTPA